MCLFCLSCFRSFFSYALLFFFLLYVCSHYMLYYFFLTLLSLYLIWFPCDIKLFERISLNILPLATCLDYFLFSSALSVSSSLLLLYLSLILSSSSVISGFLPLIFFIHGESSSFSPVSLLLCLFVLLLSFTSFIPLYLLSWLTPCLHTCPDPEGSGSLCFGLLSTQRKIFSRCQQVWNQYPFRSSYCPRLLYQWTAVFVSIPFT